MNTHSSVYYSIDKDYNILSYNDTAKQLYPNLQPGVKCYKALMGLDHHIALRHLPWPAASRRLPFVIH